MNYLLFLAAFLSFSIITNSQNPATVSSLTLNEILDYFKQFRTNGYSIPSYELWLDVVSSAKNNFSSKQISVAEFNK